MNISKEVLSEVLGEEVLVIKDLGNDCLITVKTYNGSKELLFNIYELAHKCKEWANTKAHTAVVVDPQVKLLSYIDRFGGHCRIKLFPAQSDETDVSFHENTEPEAIFKATQWVYDNIKQ